MSRFIFLLACVMIPNEQRNAFADSNSAGPTSLKSLRNTFNEFLVSQSKLRAKIHVTNLVRMSNSRLCEKSFHIDCVIRDGVAKISHYGEGIVDGKKQWFDLRETLLFSSGDTIQWRHPNFPGKISFGIKSSHASRIKYDADRLGHPLFMLNRIREILARKASKIISESADRIVVRTSPFANPKSTNLVVDYLEIVFSKQFDGLPISLTRYMPDDNPAYNFSSGASVQIEYGRALDSSVFPVCIQRDRRLKDDVEGILNTKWEFQTFDRAADISIDDLQLTLPLQIRAEDVDTKREFLVVSEDDDSVMTLKKRFGDYIQFVTRNAAKKSNATSFVGQCPDLPTEHHSISERPIQPVPSLAGNACLLASHAIILLGVGALWRRRHNSHQNA